MPTARVELWPDEKLLELLQGGDRIAFNDIYNRYWSKLYLSAYNILRDRQTSEDIVQEVLVSLWLKRETLAIESLHCYLYGAIRYQVFKAIRAGKSKKYTIAEANAPSVENEAENVLCEQDINNLLEQSVAKLPEKCRQIFLLSRKQHLSTSEIAVQLGIASKTVENQLTIALRRLRASMSHLLCWAAALFING